MALLYGNDLTNKYRGQQQTWTNITSVLFDGI